MDLAFVIAAALAPSAPPTEAGVRIPEVEDVGRETRGEPGQQGAGERTGSGAASEGEAAPSGAQPARSASQAASEAGTAGPKGQGESGAGVGSGAGSGAPQGGSAASGAGSGAPQGGSAASGSAASQGASGVGQVGPRGEAGARPEEPAAAKETKRPRWWGPEPRPKVSGYGGPALRFAGLHGQFAALIGLEGGINVIQRVTIGASLLWLLNPVEAGSYARGGASRVNLNYGGLVVDVSYVRRKRVAGTLGGLIGGGGACLQNPNNGDCADKTGFFVGEPRAGVRVVLAPVVRLHLALGYRFVVGRAWSGPPDPRLGGPSGAVTLEFGWF